MITLTVLGCHAATPKLNANPSAQLLEIANHMFLVDCGEGTQMQLRRSKVKFARIKHIFISHLHGDHFFGLVGLISTFQLLGREAELTVYGPKGIKEIITSQFKLGKSWTSFPLYFIELSSSEPETIFEDDKIVVSTLPLKHRVYTNGFLFKEKEGARRIDINAAVLHKIDKSYFNKLKQGGDVLNNEGELIKNDKVTLPPYPPQSYAYCSDTMFFSELSGMLPAHVILYHESTFLDQHDYLCEKTKHSTAKQAAQIAKQAQAKALILGHFSGRYASTESFREEAKTVFDTVYLAEDGKKFTF